MHIKLQSRQPFQKTSYKAVQKNLQDLLSWRCIAEYNSSHFMCL